MKKLHIAAALCAAGLVTSACVTPTTDQVGGAVIGAIAAETAAAARCPRSSTERGVLLAGRVSFDLSIGALLSPTQRQAVDDARAETDRRCGSVAVDDREKTPASP
jgi:hypothetical protein